MNRKGIRKMMRKKIRRYLAGVLCGVMFLGSPCGAQTQASATEQAVYGAQTKALVMEQAVYAAQENADADTDTGGGQETAAVSLSWNDGSAEENDAEGGEQTDGGVSVSGNDENDGGEEGEVPAVDDENGGDADDVPAVDDGNGGGETTSVSGNDTAQEEGPDPVQDAAQADVSSAADIFQSGTAGDDITWTIYLDGRLTVEGSGEINKWDHSVTRAPWHDYGSGGHIKTAEVSVTGCQDLSYLFSNCSDLTYVDFGGSDLSSVTNMNRMFYFCTRLEGVDFGTSEIRDVKNISMFEQCYMLKSVDMSHFHTSHVTTMSGLFRECWALTSVAFGEWDTGNVTDMSKMFYNCYALASLDVSGFDTTKVITTSDMFYGCKNLGSLDVSGFDTSKVTDMSGMFHGCSNLASLDLSGFDTSKVTDMSDMFYDCGNLTALDVDGFRMENVTNVTGMFTNCRSLERVDLSHFDIKGVTSLANLFSGCSKLKSVSLVCAGESSVTDISNMFSRCSSLTSVSLNGFDNNKITNMSRLFYGCWGLQHIDLSHFSTANVTDMSYMFGGCSGLTELNLDGFQASAARDMSHMFEGCSKLERLDLSALSTGNAENMSYMFSGCYNLQNVDLAQVDTSKVTDMSHMFFGCSKLTEVSVKDFNTANVRNMAYMFYNCAGLTDIDAERFDTSKVTDMSYMFSGCENLKTLNTSGFVGGCVTSAEHMFYMCKSLTALDMSSFGAESLTTAEGMFQSCEALKTLNLKGFGASRAVTMEEMFSKCYELESINLKGFDTSSVENMADMFQECMSLKTLDVSGFDTSHVRTMRSMFNYCDSLVELDLSGFDTGSVTTMQGMISTCRSLKRLDLSGFDTSRVVSMNGMFASDAALTSLDISSFDTSNVTDMGFMFLGCKALKSIDVSHFDTSRVTDMTWMFFVCEGLTTLDLGGFDMSSVTSAGNMLVGCQKLSRIYTPCNLNIAVGLAYSTPVNTYNEVWYQADGTKVQQLPMNLSHSIVIEKNKKPAPQAARLEVSKGKTAYDCGETLNLDDLTVRYRDANGALRVVTDYTTNAAEIDMSVPGKKTLTVSYRAGGSTLRASVELTVTYVLEAKNVAVTVDERDCTYDGTPATPSVAVRVLLPDGTAKTLVSGEDYTVSYRNNLHAYGYGTAGEDTGAAPEVRITGTGDYRGTVTAGFRIRKAALVIAARTQKVARGEAFPGTFGTDAYETDGLFGQDKLIKEPVFTVTDAQGNAAVVDTSKAGASYRLMPGGADAGPDYDITYRSGMLVIVEDKYSCTVLFRTETTQADTLPYAAYYDVAAGSLIEKPDEPKIDGFSFAGWYRDTGFLKPWDFEADVVQEDMTLYACLLRRAAGEGESGLRLCVQDIAPQTYTGSAVRPKVTVYAADGTTPLKAGKDYTIKYANHVAAVQTKEDGTLPEIGTAAVQKAGRQETLQMLSGSFTRDCPYVIITGKGNYRETVYKNFYILPTNIAAAGNREPAAGFTMRCSEQLVKNNKKPQDPFASLKYKKPMKLGIDYTLTLKANGDVTCDHTLAAGELPQEWIGQTTYNGRSKKYTAPAIPAGYAGTFTLTVTGKGNYTGKIIRHIYLADEASGLMKNARITLGKEQKKTAYVPGGVRLTPGYYDAEQKQYHAVEDGKESVIENGNDIFTVSVKRGGKTVYLKYSPDDADSDYLISYRDNDRAGTATLTLSGNPEKGYLGQKSVTFQITGTPFSAKTIGVKAYDGTEPGDPQGDAFRNAMSYTGRAVTQNKVTLTTKVTPKNPEAQTLTYGEHYTIAYKNNVKKGTATVTFTARPESGYSGSFQKTFRITPQELSGERLTITPQGRDMAASGETLRMGAAGQTVAPEAAYRKNGAKLPFVITNEAGTVLREGTDYTVRYKNNNAVTTAQTPENKKPLMTVTGKGNYAGKVEVPFAIVQVSLADALENGTVTVSCAQVQKKNGMKLKDLKFKLMEGKKTLGMGETKDYVIDETGCTPEILRAYADAVAAGTALPEEPVVKVTGQGYYTGEKTIALGRYLYAERLTAANLYVVVSEGAGQSIYTGGQVTPDVAVYYGEKTAVSAAKKDQVKEETALTAQSGRYKLTKLEQKPSENAGDGGSAGNAKDGDYTVSYGANIAAGKNKGSVTVTGAGRYGGSVTVKFEIGKKAIY